MSPPGDFYSSNSVGASGSSSIPDGTLFKYQSGDWKTTYLNAPADIVRKVQAKISSMLMIRSHTETIEGVVGNVDAYLGAPANFSVEMTVQVKNGLGYANVDDPASIIDNAVYQVVGVLPTHTVPSFQLPGNAAQKTGQPGSGGENVDTRSFLQRAQDALSNITSKTGFGLGLLAVGLIIGIILVAQAGAMGRE